MILPQKLLILDSFHVHLYRKYVIFPPSKSASLMHIQVYCKQLLSEQSDKCRYSYIKNSSQLGCVSTRPLFLSAIILFPMFCTNAANKYYK